MAQESPLESPENDKSSAIPTKMWCRLHDPTVKQALQDVGVPMLLPCVCHQNTNNYKQTCKPWIDMEGQFCSRGKCFPLRQAANGAASSAAAKFKVSLEENDAAQQEMVKLDKDSGKAE
eukprot:4690429-Amphidinium_carterae.1